MLLSFFTADGRSVLGESDFARRLPVLDEPDAAALAGREQLD